MTGDFNASAQEEISGLIHLKQKLSSWVEATLLCCNRLTNNCCINMDDNHTARDNDGIDACSFPLFSYASFESTRTSLYITGVPPCSTIQSAENSRRHELISSLLMQLSMFVSKISLHPFGESAEIDVTSIVDMMSITEFRVGNPPTVSTEPRLGGGNADVDRIDIVCKKTFVRSEELLLSLIMCIMHSTAVESSKNILENFLYRSSSTFTTTPV
mmetsp:Transcript_12087/g.19668  ORF Transcript_12087/g.19668 Transcript_12087/m.19668 type:complete len:215 (+) Transcript_12087:3244-3888(+)